jgi:hypothetical protein
VGSSGLVGDEMDEKMFERFQYQIDTPLRNAPVISSPSSPG